MSSPLAALTKAYSDRIAWLLAMPYIGLPTAVRGTVDISKLPKPDLNEPNTRTKEPQALGVSVSTDAGKTLLLLKSPCSHAEGCAITRQLVLGGVHPLDIIVGTYDYTRASEPNEGWTIRTAVDHMWWSYYDQIRLNNALAAEATT